MYKRQDGNITSRLITNYDKSDPEVESYIGDINAEFEGILNEVVAKTAVNLVINEPSTIYQEVKKRLIRNSETNMGDFCADAYRYVSCLLYTSEKISEMQAVLDRLDMKIEGYEDRLLKCEEKLKK